MEKELYGIEPASLKVSGKTVHLSEKEIRLTLIKLYQVKKFCML